MGALDSLKLAGAEEHDDLHPYEAERTIRDLRNFDVQAVGSTKWLKQQEAVERLNAQAHRNARQHADEFVVENLVSFDKLSLLVHELLVFEVWKAKVYPHLRQHFANNLNSITAYLVLFYEAGLTNLLEVTLFHRHACEAVSEMALVELCDWCQRRVTELYSLPSCSSPSTDDPRRLLDRTAEQDLEDKELEIRFGCCMASLTILRYLSDHIDVLPLGIIPRLMRTNDIISALVPLISKAPWTRRGAKGTEKWQTGQWQPVPPAERLRVTQQEAQVWLTLHNLLLMPSCRDHCIFDEGRIEQLQRMRPYLTDMLFDQVPVLKHLLHFLDQLVLTSAQGASDTRNSCLIIEQVPTVRCTLLKRTDWQDIAEQQQRTAFHPQSMVGLGRLEAFINSLDMPDDQQLAGLDAYDAETRAGVRVHVWQREGNIVLHPWNDFACSLDHDRPAEPVRLDLDDGSSIFGTRHHLLAMAPDGQPLPEQAKLSVLHGDCCAEAYLELPTAASKPAVSKLPAIVWATIGLLAKDGLTLQLKLRKDGSACRNPKTGSWLVYRPVGGALNLANSLRDCEDVSSVLRHPTMRLATHQSVD